jgi:hypothetical protein
MSVHLWRSRFVFRSIWSGLWAILRIPWFISGTGHSSLLPNPYVSIITETFVRVRALKRKKQREKRRKLEMRRKRWRRNRKRRGDGAKGGGRK